MNWQLVQAVQQTVSGCSKWMDGLVKLHNFTYTFNKIFSDLSRVSPCFHPITARIGSCRPL